MEEFNIDDLVEDDGFDVDDIINEDKKKLKKGKPRKKMGRPRLKVKKEKRVIGYFTDKEYDALVDIAEERGISLSNLVRRTTLTLIEEK